MNTQVSLSTSQVQEIGSPFLKREKELLGPCGGQLDLAHPDIKKEIQEMKREFDEEWGSKGRLRNCRNRRGKNILKRKEQKMKQTTRGKTRKTRMIGKGNVIRMALKCNTHFFGFRS